MNSKILDSFGSKIGEQWVANLLTPAFAFWLGGGLAIIQCFGWQQLLKTFTDYPQIVQGAIGVLGFCTLAFSAFVAQRLDLTILRFLEGYWHPWLVYPQQWLILFQKWRFEKVDKIRVDLLEKQKQQEKKRQELIKAININNRNGIELTKSQRNEYHRLEQSLSFAEQQKLNRISLNQSYMPNRKADFMPTRLGNILRTAERKPLEKYGLDAVICWPRLWMLLPDGVKKDIQESRTELNTAVRVWFWSMLFCGWAILAVTPQGINISRLWPIAVSVIVAYFAYGWAITAAKAYGEQIEASFDLYRQLLYQSLRFKVPTDLANEQSTGLQLTRYLCTGQITQEEIAYSITPPIKKDKEQIFNLIQQLSFMEKCQIRQELERESAEQSSDQHAQNDFLVTFDQIGKEAQEKGLTEEILAGLLADES
jgi:hypothetical protein